MEKLAYIAGLFDGEGCVMTQGKGYLTITITNSNERALNFVKNVLDGSIYHIKSSIQIHNKVIVLHKPIHRYSLCGKPAANALKKLLPYLIIKKEEAILGIKISATTSLEERAKMAAELSMMKHL